MPLMRLSCAPYYEEHIKSNVVRDCIVEGRKNYPVIDLCNSGEFALAYELLSKGYKCLHEDSGADAAKLMRRALSPHETQSSKKEGLPAIVNYLYEEIKDLQQTDETGYKSFINSFGYNLTKQCGNRLLSHILIYMKRNMPDVYLSMTTLGNWDISTLIEFNNEFVEEYILNLKCTDGISDFIDQNKLTEEDTLPLLSYLFECDDKNTLEIHLDNLFEIGINCPEIYPCGFTCDVAILTMIKMFRIDMWNNPGVSPSDFETEAPFCKNVGRFNRLISFHLRNIRNEYSLDRVIHTLIVSYLPYGNRLSTSMESDYYLLDCAIHHTSVCLPHIKISLSADAFEKADKDWKYEYVREEPELDDGYTEMLNRLKQWYNDNFLFNA